MNCVSCDHEMWEHVEGDGECRCVYADGHICKCPSFIEPEPESVIDLGDNCCDGITTG